MKSPRSLESLLQEIARIKRMERGKVCVARQGPDGPYYHHQTWENGANVCRYVPHEQIPALQEAIDGYKRFEQLTDEYARLVIEKTREEWTASRDVKKKPRRRRPFSRKTGKSGS